MKRILIASFIALLSSCTGVQQMNSSSSKPVRIITLDPGHFHAALVQKTMYADVDSVVHVYAPAGNDLQWHLDRINAYNNRAEHPTRWKEVVYTGPDFLQKMLQEKKGNVVIMAGNNQHKTEYIAKTVEAGFHVLADKPMAINKEDFELLKKAFATADKNNVLLYDIMTERFEITTMLQREFSLLPQIFGELQKGSLNDPAVVKESVHHFFKFVSGSVLTRPAWFMDVRQQGEGIVDVTTHLVDLVQWACFPEQSLNYQKDVQLLSARRWPTTMTLSEFKAITKLDHFPDYLKKDVVNDTVLNVYSNGEINYQLKGVHAKVSVIWAYKAPEGTGDTHYSIMRGSKANLVIRQGKEQNYKPVLYIEPVVAADASFNQALMDGLKMVQSKYPGVDVKRTAAGWEVVVPQTYNEGHEAHFARVMEKFLQYLKQGKLPEWEVPNMIAKYYTTTTALELATQHQNTTKR